MALIFYEVKSTLQARLLQIFGGFMKYATFLKQVLFWYANEEVVKYRVLFFKVL